MSYFGPNGAYIVGNLTSTGNSNLNAGNTYKINNIDVLSATSLGSGVTSSSLTSVGTLTSLTVSGNATFDTNTLFVDATNNRVGIGTTSPSSRLHVFTTNSGGWSTAGGQRIGSFGANAGFMQMGVDTTNGRGWIHTFLNGSSGEGKGTYTTLSLNEAGGRVGIGLTSVVGRLDIFTGLSGLSFNVATQATGSISFGNASTPDTLPSITGKGSTASGLAIIAANDDSTTRTALQFDVRESGNSDYSTLTNPAFTFTRFNNELITILRNGNVGIGTTNPKAQLTINQTALGSELLLPGKNLNIIANGIENTFVNRNNYTLALALADSTTIIQQFVLPNTNYLEGRRIFVMIKLLDAEGGGAVAVNSTLVKSGISNSNMSSGTGANNDSSAWFQLDITDELFFNGTTNYIRVYSISVDGLGVIDAVTFCASNYLKGGEPMIHDILMKQNLTVEGNIMTPTFTGMVGYFAVNSPPTGWLVCNGSAISRTVYSDLFNTIRTTFGSGDGSTTFNLPDLRGEFIRGWDSGRGIDSGRVFGSSQLDAMQSLTGYTSWFQTDYDFRGGGNTGVFGSVQTRTGGTDGDNGRDTCGRTYFDNSEQARTASENRPRNIALLPCIKY